MAMKEKGVHPFRAYASATTPTLFLEQSLPMHGDACGRGGHVLQRAVCESMSEVHGARAVRGYARCERYLISG